MEFIDSESYCVVDIEREHESESERDVPSPHTEDSNDSYESSFIDDSTSIIYISSDEDDESTDYEESQYSPVTFDTVRLMLFFFKQYVIKYQSLNIFFDSGIASRH